MLAPAVSPPSSRRKLAFVAVGAVPIIALGGWLIFRPGPPVDPPKPFALPTPTPTPPAPEPAKPVEAPVVPPTPTPPVVTPTPAPVPANPEPPKPDPAKAKPKKGRLQVITTRDGEPLWASVKVDGASSGETPLILDLAPGKHTVSIERAGFKPVAREFVVKPGQTAQVKAELVP